MVGTGASRCTWVLMTFETVRYNYRLRPSRTARRHLCEEGDRARWVWNQCVRRSSEMYEHEGVTISAGDLDGELTDWRNTDAGWSEWLAAGSSVVQQQAIRDFCAARSKALKDFATGVARSKRRGLPRFHSRHQSQPSVNYTRRGFNLSPEGRLVVAGGVSIPVVWSRDLPEAPTSVRVYRDASGHWWASFVTRRTIEAAPPVGRAIGIDWGVETTATTTDPVFDQPHANHGARLAKKLASAQRKMARRRRPRNQPPSKGYVAAREEAARVYQQMVWRRRDDAHKWAKQVVDHHDQIAVEDFHPPFLAKTTMAKKAADAAIGDTKRILVERGRRYGRQVVLVPPAYTTMDCAVCGARAKHRLPLSQRTFCCDTCGHTAGRDRNAATVMVVRAGFVPASADGVRPTTTHTTVSVGVPEAQAPGHRQPELGIPRL